MFSKLLSFILIYILSVINFVIILLPLLLIIVPIIASKIELIDHESIMSMIFFAFFSVSCIMNFMILIDFLFGISSKKFLKNTKECEKLADYSILLTVFDEIKDKFNKHNVQLLISSSLAPNAFAVGSMRSEYIVITKGLIDKYLMKFGSSENFLISMKCIMGHELSHLAHKDYLPTLLLEINEYSSKIVSKIIYQFFRIFITLFKIIPVIGNFITYAFFGAYKTINYLIMFFYKYITLPLYKLIYLQINRSKEYRCDKQSSMANGGLSMVSTLSILDDKGYSTLFSSHPSIKKRIKYVQNIEESAKKIKPLPGTSFINFLAVFLVFMLPIFLFYAIDFQHLQENYEDVVLKVQQEIYFIKLKMKFMLKI